MHLLALKEDEAYKVLYKDHVTKDLFSLCYSGAIKFELHGFARKYSRTSWNYATEESRARGYGLLIYKDFRAADNDRMIDFDHFIVFKVSVHNIFKPTVPKMYMDRESKSHITAYKLWPSGSLMCDGLRIIEGMLPLHCYR